MPKYTISQPMTLNGKFYPAEAKAPLSVELPAGTRFLIRNTRYIENVLVPASPDCPCEIFVPEGGKLDPGIFLADDPRASELPKPHYVVNGAKAVQSSADLHSTPNKSKRDSDKSVG